MVFTEFCMGDSLCCKKVLIGLVVIGLFLILAHNVGAQTEVCNRSFETYVDITSMEVNQTEDNPNIALDTISNNDLYSARFYEDTFEDAHGIADNVNLSISNDQESQYVDIHSSCTPDGWLLTKKIDPKNVTGSDTLGSWNYLYLNKHDIEHGIYSWTQANEDSLKVTVCDGWTNDSIAGYVDLTSRNIDISSISIVDHPSLRLNFSITSTGEVLKDFRVDWIQTAQSDYGGIPKWWDNKTFASTFYYDDCDVYPVSTVRAKWDTENHVHPFTCCVFSGKNIGNIETTGHYTWEVHSTSYGVSDIATHTFTDYTTCYNWMYETRTDAEGATTNSSRWSEKVITFTTPSYADEDFQFEAMYDAGLRTGWIAPCSYFAGTDFTYGWNNNVSSRIYTCDMNPLHEREESTAAGNLPMNKYDWLATNMIEQFCIGDNNHAIAISEVRDNRSLASSWSHGYTALARECFWRWLSEVETYDDVWMTTPGEIYSYNYWKDHVIVTYNASESSTTCRVYNTEAIKIEDTRRWNVPLTFKFTNIANFEGVNVYYTGNHTLYKSLTNISQNALDHRLMQEGYTLNGSVLYVSTIVSDNQIEIIMGGGDSAIQNILKILLRLYRFIFF